MSLSRSELREKAMIILYQIEIMKKSDIVYDVENIIKENIEIDNEFVKTLVFGVVTSYEDLDNMANKYLKDWSIDRLDINGSAILRMSIYEYLYMDTPEVVVINEAIELAKKYCDDKVKNIINAVLDKVINNESRV